MCDIMYRVVAIGVVNHPTITQQFGTLGRAFGMLHRLDDSHQWNIAAGRTTVTEPPINTLQSVNQSIVWICLVGAVCH